MCTGTTYSLSHTTVHYPDNLDYLTLLNREVPACRVCVCGSRRKMNAAFRTAAEDAPCGRGAHAYAGRDAPVQALAKVHDELGDSEGHDNEDALIRARSEANANVARLTVSIFILNGPACRIQVKTHRGFPSGEYRTYAPILCGCHGLSCAQSTSCGSCAVH